MLNCIPASALGLLGLGGLLVLSHLELLVRVAPRAVGVTALGHVHHLEAGVVASENYQILIILQHKNLPSSIFHLHINWNIQQLTKMTIAGNTKNLSFSSRTNISVKVSNI